MVVIMIPRFRATAWMHAAAAGPGECTHPPPGAPPSRGEAARPGAGPGAGDAHAHLLSTLPYVSWVCQPHAGRFFVAPRRLRVAAVDVKGGCRVRACGRAGWPAGGRAGGRVSGGVSQPPQRHPRLNSPWVPGWDGWQRRRAQGGAGRGWVGRARGKSKGGGRGMGMGRGGEGGWVARGAKAALSGAWAKRCRFLAARALRRGPRIDCAKRGRVVHGAAKRRGGGVEMVGGEGWAGGATNPGVCTRAAHGRSL